MERVRWGALACVLSSLLALPARGQDARTADVPTDVASAEAASAEATGDTPSTDAEGTRREPTSGDGSDLGGALGFSALPVELPASTLVMLSAIADIARKRSAP